MFSHRRLYGLLTPGVYVAGGGGGNPIAFVKNATATAFVNQTANQTCAIGTVTAGNDLIVSVSCYRQGSAAAINDITTSGTGTIAAINKPTPLTIPAVDGLTVAAWIVQNASAGTHTIGWNPGGVIPSWGVITVSEFSGLLTASAVDATGVDNDQSSTPANNITTGPTATLAQANNLIITGLALESDNNAIATPSGYTDIYKSTGAGNIGTYFGYKIVSATTAVSAAHSWGAVEEYQAIIGTVKAA